MDEQERKKNNSNRGKIFTFQFEPPYRQSSLYNLADSICDVRIGDRVY